MYCTEPTTQTCINVVPMSHRGQEKHSIDAALSIYSRGYSFDLCSKYKTNVSNHRASAYTNGGAKSERH